MAKPKVGIYGLTSCAGDQLVLVNCEDELLDIVGALDLKSFVMGQSINDECELDIALVEGVVANQHDKETLEDIRSRSALLIALGTCAVWGGVPASKNEVSRAEFQKAVYGTETTGHEELITPLPLSHFVPVDFRISGCPIEKEELVGSIASLLHGDIPVLTNIPVCTECKMAENICQMVDLNNICLGPVTLAGCQARCPGHNRPCVGCRGPIEEANFASEYTLLLEKGFTSSEVINRMRIFAYPCEGLQAQVEKIENE